MDTKSWIFGVLIGVLVVMTTAYFILDQENTKLNEAYRGQLNSPDKKSFVHLKSGVTHYEMAGAATSPLVVMIHGVSGPMIVWDKTRDELQKAGFRILRYDLYGRGFSDRVSGPYNPELFQTQLNELLAALEITAPFDLVGSSMGAIISSEFTEKNPQRVRKLVLVGPAGFPLRANPLAKLIYLPVLGEFLMAVTGDRNLHAHNRRYFYRPDLFADFQSRFENQLKILGSKRAILSTFRSMPLQSYLPGYERVGRQDREVMIIWGKEDRAFPFENHTQALAAIPQTHFIAVEEAGHLPQYEKAEQVNPEIIRFLQAKATPKAATTH